MSDLTERLRNACDYENETVYEFCNRAADALEAAEAKLAAIDALHQPDASGLCQECPRADGMFTEGYGEWPCDTHRILHPEEDQ